MPSAIAVLIPVLDRPQRVKPLCENLAECSAAISCLPVFLVSDHDDREQRAVREEIARGKDIGYPVYMIDAGELAPGDYARKINTGARLAFDGTLAQRDVDFVFFAADDLYFHPGWAERGIAAWYETHACVIGTNDLANPSVMRGEHATHSLVHRNYAECGTIDEEGKLLHEGYFHEFVDNEFVETARARETFHHATDVLVQHAHPTWHTAEMDETYERGQANHQLDYTLFTERRRLWQ